MMVGRKDDTRKERNERRKWEFKRDGGQEGRKDGERVRVRGNKQGSSGVTLV